MWAHSHFNVGLRTCLFSIIWAGNDRCYQAATDNDRLGTTAIYLNLIDMHVVDEYTQKW
jgi:hypothetical protein